MKINKLLACLLFVGLNVAFADTTINFDTIFTADANDVSVSFLAALFGNVGTVLVGGSNQIVSQMFMVFNTGIIAFVSALVFYTLTMSVINTAQDGNAMGQKVSTWIVLRIVAGMSMLIPQYSGYSLIQIMVMWSVVQGVGFADNIWTTALETMKDYGGSVAVPSQNQYDMYGNIATIATGDSNVVPIGEKNEPSSAASIFAAAVCTKAKYNQAVADGGNPSIANYGYFQTSAYVEGSSPETWCFGYSPDGNAATCDHSCGEFTINSGAFYAQALADMVLVTAPAAISWYDSAVSACEGDSTKCELGDNNGDASFTVGCGNLNSENQPEYSQDSVCVAANILNSGASTYYSTSLADRIGVKDSAGHAVDIDAETSWVDTAESNGWAMAGAHYMDLSGGGNTTNAYTYSGLDQPNTSEEITNYVSQGDWSKNYSNSAWYEIYEFMMLTTSQPKGALAQYMISSNAWSSYMKDQAITLATDMGCHNTTYKESSGLFNFSLIKYKRLGCSGAGSSNASAITYDKFTAYMLQSLISGYKPAKSSSKKSMWGMMHSHDFHAGSSDANPFGSLGSGKSMMFPKTKEGNFTTFPLYVWSLLTKNLSTLAGINLYKSDSASKIYAKNMTAIPNITQGCLKVASVCSAHNPDKDYTGCLDAAIQYGCVDTNNIGLLGGVRAANKQELVDPLYSMSVVGQTFIKYSTAYWSKTIKAVYDKTIALAGAYTGVGIATAVGMSGAAFGMVMATQVDVSGFAAILTGAAMATYQLLFQIDKVVMEAYLPLGSAVALVFFLLGVVLGVYLPFIPFLLFLFGLINWLISVIEAMVAAPLVAMGVTHPEGHDLLGKAEQSVMLLLGVFIRPAAMIIGFIIAITLVYLMMQFLNYGFVYTANPLLQAAAVDSAASFNMIAIVGILLVYAYVAIEVINQCFGMIFQVPDKIMRWIGGPQEQSNVSQMMQSVKGGVQSGAQGGGSAASGQASRGAQVSAGSTGFQKMGDSKESSNSQSEGGKES